MKYFKKLLIFLSSFMLCVGVSCDKNKVILTAVENYSPAGENNVWAIPLSTKYQDQFDVKSIYKFTSRNYDYFLTTQRKSPTRGSPYISKIQRACYTLGESTVDEFSEILVECAGMNGTYNLVQAAHVGKPGLNLMKSLRIRPEDEVLFATFSKSKTNNSDVSTTDSAMCIYTIDAIKKKFMDKIRNCFNSVANPQLNEVLLENKCVGTISTINIDTECIRGVKNVPFDGNESVRSSPPFTFTAFPIGIISARKENRTVVFIGTSDGYLKTFIVNDTESFIYLHGAWSIEKHSTVNFTLQLSPDESLVLMRTINGIKKIGVPEIPCRIFTTYDSCLQSDIKSCGWCGLSNQCTKKFECKQNQKNGAWLDYDFRMYIKIIYINSRSFERTSDEIIEMTTENMLANNEQFKCSFEIRNEIYTTSLTLHQSTAICPTPSANKISTIPLDHDHLNATLRIESNHIPHIASINITFYDCRTYDSCYKCVSLSTKLKCDWYIRSKTCRPRYQTTGKTNYESVVTDNNSNCPPMNAFLGHTVDTRNCNECNTYDECLSRNLPNCGWCLTSNKCSLRNECSHIIQSQVPWIRHEIRSLFSIHIDQTNFSISILHHKSIHNERLKLLQCSLSIPDLDFSKYEFYCKLTIETLNLFLITSTTVSKKTNSYTVICETPILNRKLSIPSSNNFIKANLTIESDNIPNICNTSILFFDCNTYNSYKACISSNFECQWCSNERICTFNATNPCKINTKTCLNSLPPSITSIKPVEGPCEGGTNLTILGENLGCTFEDISRSIIKVAGIPCVPLKENYVPTKTIVCNINGSSPQGNLEGPVELWLNKNSFKSQQNFKFVKSKIYDIVPKQGFSYGGTELTIKGEHLDAGSSVEISVGNTSCPLIYRSPNEMKCITTPSTAKEGEIIVTFDNTIRKANNSSYKYIKDTERDENGFNIKPKGILSGGVEILIRNITFTRTTSIIGEWQFLVHINNTSYYNSSCMVRNDSTATCLSPYMSDIDHSSFSAQNPLELEYSLKHPNANVRIIFNTSKNFMKFTLYPDPEFDYFLNSSVEFNDKTYVIIKGRYINFACQKSDIKVKVVSNTCTVISLSSSQVVCSLPKSQSKDINGVFNEEYDILTELENITVQIGNHFKQIVPKRPDSPAVKNDPSENYILPIIIICIAIFLILITSSIIISKKIRAKASQKIKDTQLQMDKLQLCVAAECKEAFAELQTQISIFTSQNQCNGLPFLDYRGYVTKILFPDNQNHSFLFYGKAILIHKEQNILADICENIGKQ